MRTTTATRPSIGRLAVFEVATTEARWQDLHRKYGYARSWGLDAHLVSPVEVKQHLALINKATILGAIHIARDGDLLAVPFVERLAARAGAKGAASSPARR